MRKKCAEYELKIPEEEWLEKLRGAHRALDELDERTRNTPQIARKASMFNKEIVLKRWGPCCWTKCALYVDGAEVYVLEKREYGGSEDIWREEYLFGKSSENIKANASTFLSIFHLCTSSEKCLM